MKFANLLYRLIQATPPDDLLQFDREDLTQYAMLSADLSREQGELFADACLACGIGDGVPSRTVAISVSYI